MKRAISGELLKWKDSHRRKPLLLRGARQVGKTFIVRQLGKQFQDYVEINFEFLPDAGKIFQQNLDPHRIIRDLSLLIRKKITPGTTLLFLDEIQFAPKAISSLRYFYEMMPELHIIAAGSLLDFELERIGLPVGRVSSRYMYPLTFLEFLKAGNEELLLETLAQHDSAHPFSEAGHQRLLKRLGEYMTVGGMPEAAACFFETSDLNQCFNIHRTIIDAYRQDFGKYAGKYQVKYVELLFNTLPAFSGKKFKYSNIPGEYRKRELEPALELLEKAGIVTRVTHSSGQGVPLAAGAKPETFKPNFLDIGLSQAVLGIDTASWLLEPETAFVNKGELTEAFVGQELLGYSPPNLKSRLFYWQREARSSNAEVDYLVQEKSTIIPIEVKSGPTGTLKSLKMFLESHRQSPFGVRFSLSNFAPINGVHNYPLYGVFKLFQHQRETVRYLLSG